MKKLVIISFLLIGAPVFIFAQSTNPKVSPAELQKQIQALLKQIEELQKQVITLQVELVQSQIPTVEVPEVAAVASETIPPELARNLSRGSSGDDVRKLQEFLAKDKEVYPEGLVTGYFGPLTEVAIKKWQGKYGIEPVGAVGPKTLSKFRELGRGVIQGLLEQGAGASGQVPPGLLIAPGIQKKSETTATTTSVATTTPVAATTTPSGTIPAEPAIPAIPAIPATPAVSAQPVTTVATTTAATASSPLSYGSALNLSNVSNLLGKIWGPGSNGFIVGGGLNFSTKTGVGWSQQYSGIFVTSYSIQGPAYTPYLTQTNSVNVTVTGPAGSIIEVWDLESLTVIATNIINSGPVTFAAQPNHRYGGFAWYADNSQKDIAIYAAYSSAAIATCTAAVFYGGYSVPSKNNGESVTVVTSSQVPNGTRSASTTFTCSNGSFSAGPETANIICNSGYTSIGTQCVASSTATSTPTSSIPQVQGFTATVSGTSVILSWQDVTGTYSLAGLTSSPSTSMFGSYNIYRGSSADFIPSATYGIPSSQINLIAQGSVLSYTNSNLSAGTYYYKIALQDKNGTVGPASQAVSAVIQGPAFVTVLSPNGGEAWVTGQSYAIRWNAQNIPADTKLGLQLSYRYSGNTTLYEDGIGPYYAGSANADPASGTYQWSVPTQYGNGYEPNVFKVHAYLFGPNIPGTNLPQDYSDAAFTITAPASTTTSSLDSRAKNLAAISQTLNTIREKLIQLLQGL